MKEIKEIVKAKYGKIAEESEQECCSPGCCGSAEWQVFENDNSQKEGYVKEADLGLGCGLPLDFAKIKKGDTVVDLGSGAGNDAFIARTAAGENGRVIGVDFTEAMISKARQNKSRLGYGNVEFLLGDLEMVPLQAETADVVVSNCVFNLVPNKEKAFSETYRILKSGGHFSISDIVTEGPLPEGLKQDAEELVGCISGSIQLRAYLELIQKQGFRNISLQKKNAIALPEELLDKYLEPAQKMLYNSEFGIYSITVYAEK